MKKIIIIFESIIILCLLICIGISISYTISEWNYLPETHSSDICCLCDECKEEFSNLKRSENIGNVSLFTLALIMWIAVLLNSIDNAFKLTEKRIEKAALEKYKKILEEELKLNE